MSKSVEDAKAKVAQTREAIDAATPQVITEFEATLAEALDKMSELAVIHQQEHTTGMDVAERTVLKANLGFASETAKAGVRSALERLPIESLAKGAQARVSGTSFVQAAAILSPLLQPTGELLADAGYSIRSLQASSFDRDIRIGVLGGSGSADVAARGLDRLIDAYGKAQIELREAIDSDGRDAARSAWDSA